MQFLFITPTVYILEVHTNLAQTAKDLLSQLDMKEPLVVTATCIMCAYIYITCIIIHAINNTIR